MSQFVNATDAPDGSDGPGIGTGTLIDSLQVSVPAHSSIFLPSSSTAYYVGNVASLLLSMASGSDTTYGYQLNFTQDSQGLFAVASFNYSKVSHLPTIDQIPVCAPFLSITFGNNSAGAIITNLTVQTLSSYVPGIGAITGNSTAGGRILCRMAFQAIAANASVTVNPDVYIPGLVYLSLFSQGQSGFAHIFTVTGTVNGTNTGHVSVPAVANGNGDTRAMIAPNDDWQLAVTNTGSVGGNFVADVTTGR